MNKPLNTYCLLKFSSDLIQETSEGFTLIPEWDVERYQNCLATVVMVPELSMAQTDPWTKLTIDCQVGDEVILHYLFAQTALATGRENKHEGTWFVEDGNLYAYVPYEGIRAFRRNGELIAAPGYCVCSRYSKATSDDYGTLYVHDDPYHHNIFRVISAGADTTLHPEEKNPGPLPAGTLVITDESCAYDPEIDEARHFTPEPIVIFEKHLIFAKILE